MNISLVIPAFNEGAIIKDTVNSALDKLSGKFGNFELLIVDDGSTDNTRDAVSPLLGSNVALIECGKNKGKGSAVRTGMLASHGDLVFFTDADLAYGLDVIETGARLLADTGADIVVGSRRLDPGGYGDYPPLRKLASQCFSFMLRTASGIEYDTQCGVKGFVKHAADDIFKDCVTDSFSFDFEAMMLASRRGYKVVQMPVRIINHRPTRLSVARDGFKMLGEVAEINRNIRKTERNPKQ